MDDRVFITSQNLVFALDRRDGHVAWSKQIGELQLVPAAAWATTSISKRQPSSLP